MHNALKIDNKAEERVKQQLRNSILRKRDILEEWTTKVEELKMEIQLIKNEYHVRVGSLILKDNQLDLEILQYKNLKDLMSQGMSYGEAVRHEEDKFYNEILRMQKEQETIDMEQEMLDKREEVPEPLANMIKDLWKKLIRKFHPDLVLDHEEKQRREDIMKKINQAYADYDLETLKKFENDTHIDDIESVTVEHLEQILIDIENMIVDAKLEFNDLKESEWYAWKIKMAKTSAISLSSSGRKKEKIDVFAELEKNLLDDIVRKIKIVQQLRAEVTPQEVL